MMPGGLIGKENYDMYDEIIPKIISTEINIESYTTVEKLINKKEGNKMIESINLIDLYANKYRESIEKETKKR